MRNTRQVLSGTQTVVPLRFVVLLPLAMVVPLEPFRRSQEVSVG